MRIDDELARQMHMKVTDTQMGWGPKSNYKPGGGGLSYMKEYERIKKEIEEEQR